LRPLPLAGEEVAESRSEDLAAPGDAPVPHRLAQAGRPELIRSALFGWWPRIRPPGVIGRTRDQ
jgi:hypothetical protein